MPCNFADELSYKKSSFRTRGAFTLAFTNFDFGWHVTENQAIAKYYGKPEGHAGFLLQWSAIPCRPTFGHLWFVNLPTYRVICALPLCSMGNLPFRSQLHGQPLSRSTPFLQCPRCPLTRLNHFHAGESRLVHPVVRSTCLCPLEFFTTRLALAHTAPSLEQHY